MADITRLRVSLTKNGYFKVAEVLKRHAANEVLQKVDGVYDGVSLKASQVCNILGADPDSLQIPSVWDEARDVGEEAIEKLVFIAIVFSHYILIHTFSRCTSSTMQGQLSRADLGQKAFTNLVYSMEQIGLCERCIGAHVVNYDLRTLVEPKIGPLARKVLLIKLRKTGWEPPTEEHPFFKTFYEQCEYFGFHRVFGLTVQAFREWIEG